MKVERVNVNDLRLDERNARAHPDGNLRVIEQSLAKFGQQKPIVVDESGVVIAGNGLLIAARRLGWQTVNVVRTGLAEDLARAYALADNRAGELSEWDWVSLARELESLKATGFDLADIGWEPHEVEPLMNADFTPREQAATAELHAKPIKLTIDQRTVVDAAIAKMRTMHNDSEVTEGRCIELICAEFMS